MPQSALHGHLVWWRSVIVHAVMSQSRQCFCPLYLQDKQKRAVDDAAVCSSALHRQELLNNGVAEFCCGARGNDTAFLHGVVKISLADKMQVLLDQ